MSQDISDIDRYPRSGKFIMLSPRRRDRGTVHHFYEIYFLISLLDLFVYFFWYASGIYVLLTTFKPFKCSTNVARNLQKLDEKGKHSTLIFFISITTISLLTVKSAKKISIILSIMLR